MKPPYFINYIDWNEFKKQKTILDEIIEEGNLLPNQTTTLFAISILMDNIYEYAINDLNIIIGFEYSEDDDYSIKNITTTKKDDNDDDDFIIKHIF